MVWIVGDQTELSAGRGRPSHAMGWGITPWKFLKICKRNFVFQNDEKDDKILLKLFRASQFLRYIQFINYDIQSDNQ